MSMEPQTPRRTTAPTSGLILLGVGLLAGAVGGVVLVGLLPGIGQDAPPPEANLSANDPRSGPQNSTPRQGTTGTGQDTTGPAPDTGQAPDSRAGQIPSAAPADSPAADPLANQALRTILDRQAAEDARRRERAQLASESPLTPPVSDIAETIRARKEKEQDISAAAQPADGRADGRANGGPNGGTDAFGEAPAQAEGRATRPEGGPEDGFAAVPGDGFAPTPAAPARATHVLARGSVIPAVLETALESDLPGLVRARVSEDVYDSLTGRHVLIARGSQLIGSYGARAQAGQQRLFVRWTGLRLPDGTPVDLPEYTTLGPDGAAGVKGRRSTGLFKTLGAAVLFDLAGNATQILTGADSTSTDSDLATLIAGAAGNATSRVAERYLSDLIDRGPRFRVKAGSIMNVLVEADMSLPALRTTR